MYRLSKRSYNDGTGTKELESYIYERGNRNSSSNKSSRQIHTEKTDDENELKTETYFDYAGRETIIENPYKIIEKDYYGDGNLKRERVLDKTDNLKCVSDVLYFYNDRGQPDITLTGYKPGETYFISKNLYTQDGLPEYDIVWLDAQTVDLSAPVLPEKTKASVTKYEYDEAGNVIKESTLLDEFTVSDIASAKFAVKTEREYDIPNNTVTEKSGKIKTVYVYNYLDKPVTVKNIVKKADIVFSESDSADESDETALITENSYDENGNLIKTKTPSGSETEYCYDNLDRLTETVKSEVPSEDGSDTTGTLTESLSYNWAGSVTKKVLKYNDQIESESEYYYDSRNNMILSIDKVDGKEAATSYEYNRAGLVVAEAAPESFAETDTEETDPVLKYSVSNSSGHIKYIYDSAGRLKAEEFNGLVYNFDEGSGTMTASGDSFVINAYEYDANDNVIKEVGGEEYAAADSETAARGKTYTYSGTGNLLTERYPECDRDYNTLYEYDALGNVTVEKVLKGTSGSARYSVTNTGYVQDSDGITTYTQKTLESSADETASADALKSVKTWKTDINGNVIEESIGKKSVKKEYNSLGFESRSVTEADRYTENDKETIVNSEIKTLYDNEGNPAVIIHNSGIVEINEYDNLRRLVSETTGKRPEGVSDNQLSASELKDSVSQKWVYDAQGNIRFEYDGNGFKTEYQYDELNRLVNTVKKYGSDKVSEIKNKYNLDGNLIEKTTLLNDIQTGKETFVYDGLGRVVQKSDADVPYEYIEYNRNSDQVKSFDAQKVQKQFEYNANRQFTKTILSGVCTEELEYDYAGNVCKKTDGEGNSSQWQSI